MLICDCFPIGIEIESPQAKKVFRRAFTVAAPVGVCMKNNPTLTHVGSTNVQLMMAQGSFTSNGSAVVAGLENQYIMQPQN